MKKISGWTGLLVLLAWLISGCAVVDSSQVSSSTDYASYTATYNAQTNSAQFSAHFSVGGTTGTVLELNDGSSVTLDGSAMSEQRDIFNDIYYDASENSLTPEQFQQDHQFLFVDQSGVSHTNSFQFPYLIVPASGQSMSASLQSGFTVSWVAQDAGAQASSVSATLTRSDGTSVSTSGQPGSQGTLVFEAASLQSLGASSLQLMLCSVYDTGNIQGDADGGDMQISSCSQPSTVTLN